MKTLFRLLFVSVSALLLSACTVVIDKDSGLASTQYRGREIMRHGYGSRSGVWVTNPYPDLRMVVDIRVMVKQYVRTRHGRDRRGYVVYTTPCPPNRVVRSRTFEEGFGRSVFAASPTILMDENYVEVDVTFYDRSGARIPGKSREFHVSDNGNGWGAEMRAEFNREL